MLLKSIRNLINTLQHGDNTSPAPEKPDSQQTTDPIDVVVLLLHS
jgi:hypothetical protein